MTRIYRLLLVVSLPFLVASTATNPQDFQGKAIYFSKSSMDLGSWGRE